MKKLLLLLIVSTVTLTYAELLQKGNWRFPYYLMATEMDYAENTSASGMFWDGVGSANLFEKSLWQDSSRLLKNHWFFEPAVDVGFVSDHPDSQESGQWKVTALNSITYKNILIRQTLHADKKYDYDPDYPAHQDRAARGRIEEAFLQVNWKYGFFRLGRTERNWGPFADRSLFLSSNPYSYDALEWQIQSSFFEFRHLFAAFPLEKSNMDTDGRLISRYFSAHALNLILGKWATVGVFESILFTRDKGIPDLSLVNPFSIYTVINTNQEGSGNLMLGIQWNIHPFTDNISWRGQIVWDDFQVDDETATDKEPTHWGMDMGLYWRNPIPSQLKNSLKLEYNLKSKWLYTVPDDNTNRGERYTYLNKSLGGDENDGYRVCAGFDLIGKKYWASSIVIGYNAKGGNTPLSRWNDLKSNHTAGLPFDSLSLPIEKQIDCGLNFYSYFKDYANLKFAFNNIWVRNENNIKTAGYEYSPMIQAELSIHFSDLIVKLPD
jgi:hypothetical protein